MQVLDPSLKCAVLVVVVPGHTTTTQYTWEKMEHSSQWTSLMVPADTCVLYARSSGKYRCLVEGEKYQFEVKGIASCVHFVVHYLYCFGQNHQIQALMVL